MLCKLCLHDAIVLQNVLFVVKLNPHTTDEDLEIIFSRFGEIKCCEIIRDWKTGDSLNYAFIEFADRASCEEAYLKMDNVSIDDRRIKVRRDCVCFSNTVHLLTCCMFSGGFQSICC
jgi:RNA recognition motif-containing protein